MKPAVDGKLFLAAFLWLGVSASGLAAVRYVRPSASGAADGSSWADAFPTLPPALAAAATDDQIWVVAGTYLPTATADRTATFAMKNGVALYGGFNGTETLLAQRNPSLNVAVLSGNIGAPAASDNSYHVVTADGTVTATGVLDGFTIAGGQADGGGALQNRGGGILVSGGSPTLSNLIVSGNFASDRGGGMRVESGSPTLAGCTFQSNSAQAFGGGGLSAGVVGTLRVTACIFEGNSAANTTGGGAIHASNNVAILNSLFVQNSPHGLIFAQQGNSLVNCTITGNAGYAVTFADVNNTIANSILWGDGLGEIDPFLNDPAISYSDVQGGHFGAGNIDADPLFVDAGAGDERLGFGSPAVDAGNNAAVPGGVTADLSGLGRFLDDPSVPDTGAGTAPIVDMGAYERVPSGAPTPTATLTPTRTSTPAATVTATPSRTATPGSTPFPPTATPTRTPTLSLTGTPPTQTPTPPLTALPTGTPTSTPMVALAYHTATPCRLIDTRGAAGSLGGPALLGGSDRTFVIAGACGLPSGARAVSLNITVTGPSAAGDLRLYPAGSPRPLVSSINYRAGQTRANNAIAALGAGGDLTVRCDQAGGGSVHLVVDVNGYFE